jgi:transcription initiation factor TFIIE subunit alpha
MGLLNGLKKLAKAGSKKSSKSTKKVVRKSSSKGKAVKKAIKSTKKTGKLTTKKSTKKKTTKKITTKKTASRRKMAKKTTTKKTTTKKTKTKKTTKKKQVKSVVNKSKRVTAKKSKTVKKTGTKKKTTTKRKSKKAKKVILEPKKLSHSHAIKLIERNDAREFIMSIAGENGLKVYEYLIRAGKEIDEFTLADKVGLQVNFVRSLLYKLYEHKLVSFSRERDKRKGWFIYSWSANPDRLKELLIKQKDEEIVSLKKKEVDAQQLFYCENCKKSYSYTEAIENMFFCPVCGSELVAFDSEEIKKKIRKQIELVQKEKEELEAL